MSLLLCFCLLFSVASLNASAAGVSDDDGDGFIILDSSSIGRVMTRQLDGEKIQYDFNQIEAVSNGVTYVGFHAIDRSYYLSGAQKHMLVVQLTDIKPNTTYKLEFKHGINVNVGYKIVVETSIYSSGTEAVLTELYSESFTGTLVNGNTSSFNFSISSSDLPKNYRIVLRFSHIIPEQYNYGSSDSHASVYQYFSKDIVLQDLDSNASWFQKIINAIKSLPDELKSFFTNLGSQIGGFFSDLTDVLKVSFSDLGKKFTDGINNIGTWFSDLSNKLSSWFKDVGNWFKELGDRIQVFFVDLYNDIMDGLKSLFIPSEGYFNAYMEKTKTWASERFGFLYTAGDLVVSFITNIRDMLKDDFQFVFPAAEFDLNGEHYVLWNEYTVPMIEYLENKTIKFMYSSYCVILGGICSFALLNYAIKVFDKILAN